MFRKKDDAAGQKQAPYLVQTELNPYRLYANRTSSATLVVKIKNITKEPLMTSFMVELPSAISLDELGMSKSKEFRIGDINAGEEKELRITLFGGMKTERGDYTIRLRTTAHFRDYNHVINEMRQNKSIGVA
jgi:uncharacterized membrane protein